MDYIFFNDKGSETKSSDKHKQNILGHMTVLGNIKTVRVRQGHIYPNIG
jgi:hypothetical protein